MKNADLERRLVDLLKSHTWNIAVKILKEEKRVGALEAVGSDSIRLKR